MSALAGKEATAVSLSAAAPVASGRIAAIDLARGLAVALMILNHGVKGLVPYEAYPDWGLVPLHAMTRFASSLFIMVFGVALAVAFLPKVHSADWPRRRLKLLLTALVIYFWYKVLTIAEFLSAGRAPTLDALLYRSFPSFVEILGFYALALLWLPFFLPLWARLRLWMRLVSIAGLIALTYGLQNHFHWQSTILQALLVEHEQHYTWGQISRAPLVLLGLLLGEWILRVYHTPARLRLAALLAVAACGLLACFFIASWGEWHQALLGIARNDGKHPPGLMFMLFSLGGAVAVLALAVFGGERLAGWLRPLTLIGGNPLQAFIFHIFVIFVVAGYLLDYRNNISYQSALIFTLCLILATAVWIRLIQWIQARS